MIEAQPDEGAFAVEMRLQIRRIHVLVDLGMIDDLTRRKFHHAIDIQAISK
jgi:hypothetical protein